MFSQKITIDNASHLFIEKEPSILDPTVAISEATYVLVICETIAPYKVQ